MICKEMKVTPSYGVREHGHKQTVGNPLEDIAVENLQQNKREEWLEWMSFRIDQTLSRFGNSQAGKKQRDTIIKRYLEDEDKCM